MPRKPTTKTCVRCGQAYTADNPTRRYCSQHCAHRAQAKYPAIRTCPRCGKQFSPAHPATIHCSRSCAQRVIAARPCDHCGTMFRGLYTGARFCSQACFFGSIAATTARCDQCGQEFRRRDVANRFCSNACAAAARTAATQAEPRPCERCGTSFRPDYAAKRFCSKACFFRSIARTVRRCDECDREFRRKYPRQRFCSRDCAAAGRWGEGGPNWRGGIAATTRRQRSAEGYRRWRQAVLTRDGHRCRHCAATERLHAHHLLPFSRYRLLRHTVSNGLTLCHDCHMSLHWRGLAIQLTLC